MIAKSVFDYNLTEVEKEVLGLADTNEYSYLKSTDLQKILSDLHLLFLMRKDKKHYEQVIEKIVTFDYWA